MTRNIKLIVEYDGTAYFGWQYQVAMPTVQDVLEKAIRKLTGETVRVTAAGRTDTGVHARGQVVNFPLTRELPEYNIKMGLNAHLPDDVVVKSAEIVSATFNARFDATARVYQYFLMTEISALHRNYCWQVFQPMNTKVFAELAAMLTGDQDFGAFCRVETDTEHKRCIISESFWRQENGFWIYRVTANRFLHGMVRTLVGTMVDVAKGRFSVADFQEICQSCDRTTAGPAAPAKGLVLEEVVY